MTPFEQSLLAEKICSLAPIVPVLILEDVASAQGLARALVQGGLPALEVTLRTPAALDAIRAMSDIEGGVVGAGTLLSAKDVKAAKSAGAKFGVSPGATRAIIEACEDESLPLLPGTASPSEAMALLEIGYSVQKFFPAEQAGGAAFLRALASPLPQIRFCPTGGINLENARDYLRLPNVICAGGSWVAPKSAIAAQDWAQITALAREAAALRAQAQSS